MRLISAAFGCNESIHAVSNLDLNKEEFVRRKRIAEDRARAAERAALVIFFGGLIALIAFAKWQEGHRDHIPTWPIPCLFLLLFAGAFTAVPSSPWNMRRRARRNGLTCPSCHGALVGPAGEIAVASGNCAHCGEAVFREEETGAIPEAVHATVPDSSQEPAQALEPAGLACPGTRGEFQLRERAMHRDVWRPQLIVLALFSVLAIVASAILPKLKANPAVGRPVGIAVLVTFAGLYAVMFFLNFRRKRWGREYGLACPGCYGALTGWASQLAKATGCCSHCGERLFHDVPFRSEENQDKRKDFADRKRAVDRSWKSARVIQLSVAALGAGMIIVACLFVPHTGEFHTVPLANVQTGMIVGAVALMYGTFIATLWRVNRQRRKSGLACLSCRKKLTLFPAAHAVPAQIAVATGICSHCGGSIFAGEAQGDTEGKVGVPTGSSSASK